VNAAELTKLLVLQPADASGSLNRGTAMTNVLKMCIREGRQSGMHVSPTCLINGLVFDTSSGWKLDDWTALLGPLLK
jgi:hypothetical protein